MRLGVWVLLLWLGSLGAEKFGAMLLLRSETDWALFMSFVIYRIDLRFIGHHSHTTTSRRLSGWRSFLEITRINDCGGHLEILRNLGHAQDSKVHWQLFRWRPPPFSKDWRMSADSQDSKNDGFIRRSDYWIIECAPFRCSILDKIESVSETCWVYTESNFEQWCSFSAVSNSMIRGSNFSIGDSENHEYECFGAFW